MISVLDGRLRPVVEALKPNIDGGLYPVKRVVGEEVRVESVIVCDGHDQLGCLLAFRHEKESSWSELSLEPLGNDRWTATFKVGKTGKYFYRVHAWVDYFRSWREGFIKKAEVGEELSVDLLIGAGWVAKASHLAKGKDKTFLSAQGKKMRLASENKDQGSIRELGLDKKLDALMKGYPDRSLEVKSLELEVWVDREKARFSTWYELFPRSIVNPPLRHGTFKDCIDRLADLAGLGFDVLYFPPIHPIGVSKRKGKNDSLKVEPGDPGCPWAIGSSEGGHKAIHSELGSLKDFKKLIAAANSVGIEIALDIAFQCSPDHPYLKEHPEWFLERPDRKIQFAENPPKKYEDIYPFYFEGPQWKSLWEELKSIFFYWMDQGVRIFRVDNPHTKSFRFWKWVIEEVRKENPDVIFLAEAFTRPHIMYHLAKIGFTQSYTYFTWREHKHELVDYLNELTRTEVRDFFRPNFWPNTSDILMHYLQTGGRPAFMSRLVLAATLSSNYGIYGPVFELCENTANPAKKEEYFNSEKYEIRLFDLDSAGPLRKMIARVNRIRKDNPALQTNESLLFHYLDNERLLCYSKVSGENRVLCVVNLDPQYKQGGWVHLDLKSLGLFPDQQFMVRDLLSDRQFMWRGFRNYVELDPAGVPAHVFRI